MSEPFDGLARVVLNDDQRKLIMDKWSEVYRMNEHFDIKKYTETIEMPKFFSGKKSVDMVNWKQVDAAIAPISDYFYATQWDGEGPVWGINNTRGRALEALARLCKSSGELYITPVQSLIIRREIGEL